MNFTIKKFKKGLKRLYHMLSKIRYFTIKKFKKGLKQKLDKINDIFKFYHKEI